jgi:hypothetical protein
VGEITRPGKSEINLIEYPWTALWKRTDKSAVIFHEWDIDHPTIPGKKAKASWRVAGDPELGLPTASDIKVQWALLELTRDTGFPQTVQFTRYDLMKRLGWDTNKKHYEMLYSSLLRLKGVTISARNAFRDPRTGLYQDVAFSILDNFQIYNVGMDKGHRPRRSSKALAEGSDSGLPMDFFKWNDVVYNSIRGGYLATLDLNLAFSFKSDIALILYPLLLMKTYAGPGKHRESFEMELREFYSRHLGLTATPYVSKMEERLRPAHKELIESGFLQSASIVPMKRKPGGMKVSYRLRRPGEEVIASEDDDTGNERDSDEVPSIMTGDAQRDVLLLRMQEIGIEDINVADGVLREFTPEQIALQLDCLKDRRPQDPPALFLYALRRGLKPPAPFWERVKKQKQRESKDAGNEDTRAAAQAQAAAARQAQTARQREITEARVFYDELPDSAKAIVRHRIDIELNQFGQSGRLLYPHPQWLEVLCDLLDDEHFRLHLADTGEADWEAYDTASPQPALFSSIDLYVQTLRDLVASGEIAGQDIDAVREKHFPLLDDEEWREVKAQYCHPPHDEHNL